jgi:WD40 repeat protein
MKGHEEKVNQFCLSNDGKKLVGGSKDKTIKIWDL